MKKLVTITLAGAIALGSATAADAKRGAGSGKRAEVRACMADKGVSRADRGTAEFRAAARACGAKGRRGASRGR